MNGKLYRFHPVTGVDAEDMRGEPDEGKQEIAAMIRQGARLYWHLNDAGEYTRCEKANIGFVLKVMGIPLECIETASAIQ
jgi:hypothetical protein